MIRINLAKMDASAPTPGIAAVSDSIGSGLSLPGTSNPFAKIGVVLVFPLLLYVWEQNQLSTKRSTLAKKTQSLNAIKSEVEKFGSVTSIVEDLKKERELLHGRLKVIKKISGKRALKIGALRDLQRIIPRDVWLEAVSFNDGEITFEGLSRTPSSVQVMAEQLVGSQFIASALPSELKRSQVGETTLHKFKIKAKVKEL